MFSKIFLNKKNLLSNLHFLQGKTDGKICAMVKANAYGHGAKEVVSILEKEIDFFGVSNQIEAEEIRKITSKDIIVFGICEDYKKAIINDISFAVFSFLHAKKIVELSKRIKSLPKMHLCLNTGMNRYGIKSFKEFEKTINFLKKHNIELAGIYTHFSSLSCDEDYTKNQKEKFEKLLKVIPKNWKTIKHVGGGQTIFKNIHADMNRVGIELYGYGNENLKPILSIESQIVDIQHVKKGEHIGYLCGFTAQKDMTVATIPLGYGDGFCRKLSNKIEVTVNGQKAHGCGNICMDAMMIDVSGITCQIGDKVTMFDDAKIFAKIVDTSEYEILTNFSKFRGLREII